MSVPSGRRSAIARLAGAYARHLVQRRVSPEPSSSAEDVLATYRDDGLRPLSAGERTRLPAMSRCIDCGLCALVAGRVGGLRPADVATAYLRDYSRLPGAEAETAGISATTSADAASIRAALAAAADACPTGVPLAEVAAAVYRLSRP